MTAGPVRILALTLSHFRSYARGEVMADGASVALYGPNGAGKTNILEALSMLTPGRGLRRAATDEMIRAPEQVGWKITAEVETAEGEVEIATSAEGAGQTRRTVAVDGKPAAQTVLGGLVRMVWLTPAMDRLWTDTAGERRRFLDRITMGFFPGHAEVSVTYEKAMRSRNRLLKDQTFDDAWLGGLEAQMARSGAQIARARAETLVHLVAAQSTGAPDLAALFPRADLAIDGDLERRFAQILADGATEDDLAAAEIEEAADLSARLAEGRGRDAAAGRTLDGPHRSDLDAIYAEKAMPARACSTGEQKALLISLCLANARALTTETGAAPVLLLDEVAAHLDAHRRRALYGEIMRLGCQAWMTGTGPELFDGLDHAHRLAVTERDGRSHIALEISGPPS
ncbi:MAG: DNA replication/repair protein RecF [Pseudomonadota bacterium]